MPWSAHVWNIPRSVPRRYVLVQEEYANCGCRRRFERAYRSLDLITKGYKVVLFEAGERLGDA